jgi:transposase-like protein
MVGRYLTEIMETELPHFLGREPCERKAKASNHRNGSYGRKFTIRSIGEVSVNVPQKFKQAIADEMRSIFYAFTKEKAVELFGQFKARWENRLSSAKKSAPMETSGGIGTSHKMLDTTPNLIKRPRQKCV